MGCQLSFTRELDIATSAEGQKMQGPVLLATSSLAVLLDVLHCRLLTPIELEADLA